LYCAALFTKESAPVVLGLLPLAEAWKRGELKLRREYWYLVIPTLAFCGVFILTVANNSLVSNDFYAFWPAHALKVLAKSLHRLMFPWLYLAVLIHAVKRGWRIPSAVAAGLAWMVAALLPYIFLTYQDHVPSRHEYLASIGLAWSLAVLLAQL
jgi:hypothetical protein